MGRDEQHRTRRSRRDSDSKGDSGKQLRGTRFICAGECSGVTARRKIVTLRSQSIGAQQEDRSQS
jgi:hypothetical protein